MTSLDQQAEALSDLRATRRLLRQTRDDLLDAMEELRALKDKSDRVKELSAVIVLFSKTASQAIEAEKRFAKYSDEDAPAGGGGFDLDSARGEVLERLARLASARGGGNVSG